MRKILKNLFCSLFIITMVVAPARVWADTRVSCPNMGSGSVCNDAMYIGDNERLEGCRRSEEVCYYLQTASSPGYAHYRVNDCKECGTGYAPTLEEVLADGDVPFQSGATRCVVRYGGCEWNGGCTDPDPDCVSDNDWSSYSTGYDKYVEQYWECDHCLSTTSYKCANDYYDENGHTSGVTSMDLLSCKKCPTAADCTEDKWVTVSDRGVERCLFNYSGCTTIQLYRCKDGYYPETNSAATSLVCRKCPTMVDLENDTTTPWRSAGQTGYEIRSLTNPAPKVCSEVAQYRCASGYWGAAQTLSGTLSGCTRCATIMGVQSSSVAGENATRNQCCVKKGDRAKVTGGILEIDEPCCDDT
ncbi:MAG: hypothetical protein J6W40_04065 [Alphaproteobacteria bacterium]|nr:hypothetical protein [Alphaproteobacteria bacterium]